MQTEQKENKDHTCKFTDLTTEKVMLSKQDMGMVGYDILKQRKCSCCKFETYDLERTKLG